jgi:hypothetical protein
MFAETGFSGAPPVYEDSDGDEDGGDNLMHLCLTKDDLDRTPTSKPSDKPVIVNYTQTPVSVAIEHTASLDSPPPSPPTELRSVLRGGLVPIAASDTKAAAAAATAMGSASGSKLIKKVSFTSNGSLTGSPSIVTFNYSTSESAPRLF